MCTPKARSVTRDGIAGFLLGVGLGAFIDLILRHPDAPAVRPMLRSGRAVGGIRHQVEIASEDSFPATDAPAL